MGISAIVIYLYIFVGNPDHNIVLHVRLPRFLLTVQTGSILAGVGSVYQLMFANPLADPYVLGISSGAAFGAMLFAVIGLVAIMPLGGFLGAITTIILVWFLARINGVMDKNRLLVSGVIASMFFSAGISLIMYLFQKDTMLIFGVLMGNLGKIFTILEWRLYLGMFFVSVCLMIHLYSKSLVLDIISGGDSYARSVGINIPRERLRVFVLSSILIGICVAYAGIIGFVGLVTPHIIRFFIPYEQKRIFYYSMLVGALFLLVCDLIAKNVAAIELPVGVITAFIGCPFFMYILISKSISRH